MFVGMPIWGAFILGVICGANVGLVVLAMLFSSGDKK